MKLVTVTLCLANVFYAPSARAYIWSELLVARNDCATAQGAWGGTMTVGIL